MRGPSCYPFARTAWRTPGEPNARDDRGAVAAVRATPRPQPAELRRNDVPVVAVDETPERYLKLELLVAELLR
jgi:hypothetical protein